MGVVYPILFILVSVAAVFHMTVWSHTLVYDEDSSRWVDPQCAEMRIGIPFSLIPIPPLPQLLHQHLRACIPVLDDEGVEMNFGQEQDEFPSENTVFRLKGTFYCQEGGVATKGHWGYVMDAQDQVCVVKCNGERLEIDRKDMTKMEVADLRLLEIEDEFGNVEKVAHPTTFVVWHKEGMAVEGDRKLLKTGETTKLKKVEIDKEKGVVFELQLPDHTTVEAHGEKLVRLCPPKLAKKKTLKEEKKKLNKIEEQKKRKTREKADAAKEAEVE